MCASLFPRGSDAILAATQRPLQGRDPRDRFNPLVAQLRPSAGDAEAAALTSILLESGVQHGRQRARFSRHAARRLYRREADRRSSVWTDLLVRALGVVARAPSPIGQATAGAHANGRQARRGTPDSGGTRD